VKFPVSFFLLSVIASAALSAGQPQIKDPPLTSTEQGVLDGLLIGDPVVLSTEKPGSEKPKLSARFIERLLTRALLGEKPHRNGIRIFGATIDGSLDLKDAQVECQLWLNDCEFTGDMDFTRVQFAGGLAFVDSVFKGRATFGSATMKGYVLFDHTVFERKAFFAGATFVGRVSFKGARFTDKTSEVTFTNFKAEMVDLQDTRFEGPVSFDHAEIANHLLARGTQFVNTSEVEFRGLKLGGTAVFQKTRFVGSVSFVDAVVLDLLISEAPSDQASMSGINLSRALIRRQLSITKVRLKSLVAVSLRVEGPTTLSDVNIETSADLRFSRFATIDLSQTVWPKGAAQCLFQGFTFQYASAGADEPESHRALLKLLNGSTYTADVYSNLEQFFVRQGYKADADTVFIAGKRRERNEKLHGFPWVGSWLLDRLVGYGRYPWQAGIPCAFFVILGCFVSYRARWNFETQRSLKSHRSSDAYTIDSGTVWGYFFRL
jgi:uncharacterized protein YjbI with pentapeptide repeats